MQIHRPGVALCAFAMVLVTVNGARTQRPKVLLPGCERRGTCGGGSSSARGHLKPMGQQSDPTASLKVDELDTMPTSQEFYERYVRLNRPVVIRGGIKEQPYFTRWKSDDYLAKHFGDTLVMVEEQKVEDRMGADIKTRTLKQYIQGYAKPGNEWYIVQDVYPHMLADVQVPGLLSCEEFYRGMNMVVMWFSSGGTASVCHNDEQENLLTIADGSKTLLLFPPDEAPHLYVQEADRPGLCPITQRSVDMELFPHFAKAAYTRLELHEGDMLYIPRKWWHQVESPEGAGRNLAVNFWWYMGGPRDDRSQTTQAPFSIPPQPENFPKMLSPAFLTPEGKYGGYKLRWPEKLECKRPFDDKDMIKVPMSDHEYLDGLAQHNHHMANLQQQKQGQPRLEAEEEEEEEEDDDQQEEL